MWYEREGELLAVVGGHEGKDTDVVLSHGLLLMLDRKLTLLLHQDWAYPTRFRLPWLTSDVDVWQHDGEVATPSVPMTKIETRDQAGDHESTRPYRLGSPAVEWVRKLSEWATEHPDLVEAHRGNLRSWSCNGQRVLTIAGKTTVKVKAGIDAKAEPAQTHAFSGPMTHLQVENVRKQVEEGIKAAKAKKYGPFEEHHLQGQLRRYPNALLLEEPLLREVPAWRPSGGKSGSARGRGFIDLAGMDSAGDIVIVETKLGSDETLILQGVDYWVWATSEHNAAWLRDRLYAPAKAEFSLPYAVGGKGKKAPKLGKYERCHLDLLDPEISWRVAEVTDWENGRPTVEMLPPGTPPS